MGNACSGSSVGRQISVPRDPDDKELDAIELQATRIREFDDVFESAAGPLNELVEIHNGVFLAGENLKQAAVALQGATQVRILLDRAGRVNLYLWHYDDEEKEVVLREDDVSTMLTESDELSESYGVMLTALAGLNESLLHSETFSPSTLQVKHGRLLVVKSGAQDMHAVNLNRTLFAFRKHLATHAHVTSLKQAMQLFLREVSAVEDIRSLHLKEDSNGSFQVFAGDRPVDFSKMNKLSKPAREFGEALKELFDNVKEAATSLPELVDQVNTFLTQAQQFPSMMSSAATNSNLGITEIPKAAVATSANIKALSNGPRIASATYSMIKYAGVEIAEAIAKPVGA